MVHNIQIGNFQHQQMRKKIAFIIYDKDDHSKCLLREKTGDPLISKFITINRKTKEFKFKQQIKFRKSQQNSTQQ